MRIKKNGNILSSSKKTDILMSFVSISLILFGFGIYRYSNEIIGETIIFFSSLYSIVVLNQSFTKIKLHSNRIEVVSIFSNTIFKKNL